MTADWIQVIFTFFGILIALGYLRQHAKKVKIERSYYLIHGCMVKLSRYVGKYHLIYKQLSSYKYSVLLEEMTPVEAVDAIYLRFIELKKDGVENDLLNFEIDAEIKLIGNSQITNLWNELLNRHDAIGIKYEEIYKFKGDKKKCDEFIWDLPEGLLNNNHVLSLNFLKTYNSLMTSLLRLYLLQENQLGNFYVFEFLRREKK